MMWDDEETTRLGWLAVFVVILVWLIAAGAARPQEVAEPFSFRWVMPHGPSPATAITVYMGEYAPIGLAADCAPGSVCEADMMAPVGCHVVSLTYTAGGEESPPSPLYARCTEIARYDRTGDGDVTTGDFPAFMRAFAR